MKSTIKRARHIVAMGGGGFSMEPDNPLLDDFVLGLTRQRKPRVCFLATASGDAQGYLDNFYRAFPPRRAVATHLPLFGRDERDLGRFLLDQHVIYVGGGNTANMLAIWRLHGVDRRLRQAWQAGVVMAGLSAGALCWFECGVTDSFGPLAALPDGLGILAGSCCPHYDGEARRRPTYQRLIRTRRLPAGLALEDGAAGHYVGTRLAEIVSSRPQARAYQVTREKGRVVETPLPTRYLGQTKPPGPSPHR